MTAFQKRQHVLAFLEGPYPTPRGCLSMYRWTQETMGGWGDRTPTGYQKKRAPEMITLENTMMFTYRITQFLIHTSHLWHESEPSPRAICHLFHSRWFTDVWLWSWRRKKKKRSRAALKEMRKWELCSVWPGRQPMMLFPVSATFWISTCPPPLPYNAEHVKLEPFSLLTQLD